MIIKKHIFILCIILSTLSYAQDVHFSQFNNAPLMLNPALTGLFFGDQRASSDRSNRRCHFGRHASFYEPDGAARNNPADK